LLWDLEPSKGRWQCGWATFGLARGHHVARRLRRERLTVRERQPLGALKLELDAYSSKRQIRDATTGVRMFFERTGNVRRMAQLIAHLRLPHRFGLDVLEPCILEGRGRHAPQRGQHDEHAVQIRRAHHRKPAQLIANLQNFGVHVGITGEGVAGEIEAFQDQVRWPTTPTSCSD
jgi:hypothetical protein